MSFTKQRILVVDDEADVNLTIKLALEDESLKLIHLIVLNRMDKLNSKSNDANSHVVIFNDYIN